MLNDEIKKYLDQSVLCWLATSSADNIPNVSPKEIFMKYGDDRIIIANIASPQSVKNVKQNENVCVSFVDVLVQKGFQLKGTAKIVTKEQKGFELMKEKLEQMTKGKYPFSSITVMTIIHTKRILAPSYLMYPDTTEENQIAAAKKAYNL